MNRRLNIILRWLGLALVSARLEAGDGSDGTARNLALPYQDDPTVVRKIAALGNRSALTLPPFKVDAKSDIYGCQNVGPVTRGYTMRMVYAPERQTALYHGGDHQTLRSNDVWEYHLGSNTWHLIFEPDGGNQGPLKGVLMFLARKLRADPDYLMTAQEQKQYEEVRVWWLANVVLRDGYLVTRHGGPILPGHTWDTLVYEPQARLMIHGTGAYCCDAAVLHSRYHNLPLGDVEKQIDPAYTGIWMFDPAQRRWLIHRRPPQATMPELRGMGATMCYVPDLGKVIYYVAAQNVSPHSYQMWSWDVLKNEWTELQPNGGRRISELALTDRVAPLAEQQTAYSPKHRQLVAVLGTDTFAYDVVKNVWARLNSTVPIESHDAKTSFAYDSRNDVFLLTDGGKDGKVAVFSLAENKWELVTPSGEGCPSSNWGGGPYWGQPKGYYDATHNVLVIHGGYTNRVWVYRHRRQPD